MHHFGAAARPAGFGPPVPVLRWPNGFQANAANHVRCHHPWLRLLRG